MYSAMILDTETTGFDKPQVIELAYQIISDDLNEVSGGFYCRRFKPSKDIEEGAFNVHKISQESLYDEPNSDTLLRHATKVEQSKYIIGHHIKYDIDAINNSVNKTHNFKTICTKRLALKVLDSQPSYSLVNLTKSLGVVDQEIIDKAHSAEADVYMTLKLLQHIASVLNHQTGLVHNLDDLFDICESLDKKNHADYVSA